MKSVTEAAQALDASATVTADIARKHVSIGSAQTREALVVALTAAGYAPADQPEGDDSQHQAQDAIDNCAPAASA